MSKLHQYNGEDWVEIAKDAPQLDEIVKTVFPLIPTPKEGSPDTGDVIIEKINSSEEKINRDRIEGLDDLEKSFNKQISSIPRGGGGGNKGVRFYPLTPDGTTKIFTVPKSVVSKISMSDFPYVLFENSGFTINATRTQITITTDNAPSLGSQILYEYQQMFGT